MDQHVADMMLATLKKPVHGIRSKTPLADLTNFDFVKAFVPEYMHSCCQGVIKQFIKLWTDTKYSKKNWYISKQKKAALNARLLKIKPPYEITRVMASIEDLSVWKASMFRSFCLYFFPLLEDMLPKLYFKHFSKFSYGLYVLLQEKALIENVKKVGSLLVQFVKEAEILYGKEHISINMHLLTHLTEAVLDWGCLWATSTFIPEWFNGELIKLSNGTQCVAEQMSKNYLMKIAAREEAMHLIENHRLPSRVGKLLRDLFNLDSEVDYHESKRFTDNNSIELLGEPEAESLTQEEISTIEAFFRLSNGRMITLQSYPRFRLLRTGSIFTTSRYALSPKRINFCALMNDGNFIEIWKIISIRYEFESEFLSKTMLLANILGTEEKLEYTPEPIGNVIFEPILGQQTRLHGKSYNYVAYDATRVLSKCAVAWFDNKVYSYLIAALVNSLESD